MKKGYRCLLIIVAIAASIVLLNEASVHASADEKIIVPDREIFVNEFNKMTFKYSSDKPVKMVVEYSESNGLVSDMFYLEAGNKKTASFLIKSYAGGEKTEAIEKVRIQPLKASEFNFSMHSIDTENIGIYESEVYLDNTRFKLGVDLSKGGGIKHIEDKTCSIPGLTNLINNHDTGRLVQQSYYGTGACSEYTPGQYNNTIWRYNPVQGGDMNGYTGRLLDIRITDNSIYIKMQPMDWSLNGSITPSYMENTYTLFDDKIIVDNSFTDFSGYNNPVVDQELPAFYVVSYLGKFIYYNGEQPWQDDTITSKDELGFWGNAANTDCRIVLNESNSESWCAWVSPDNNFGIGLYSPDVKTLFAGRYMYNSSERSNSWLYELFPALLDAARKNPEDDATNYVAPIKQLALKDCEPMKYSYAITTGSPQEIRNVFKENKDFLSNHITFDTKGGTSVPAQTVIRGMPIEEPDSPNKQCSRFTGWYEDSQCTQEYDFSRQVTSDIKLYAGWEPAHDYKLKHFEWKTDEAERGYIAKGIFECEGCSDVKTADAVVKKSVIPATVEAEGKIVYIAEILADQTDNPTGIYQKDTKETIIPKIPKYTVSFDTDGGIPERIDDILLAEDSGIMADGSFPASPKKTGYSFVGWIDGDNNPLTENTKMPGKNIRLKAVWEAKDNIVIFRAGEGGTTIQAAVRVKTGAVVGVIPVATANNGYKLKEWECSDGRKYKTEEISSYVVREDVTFFARFERIAEEDNTEINNTDIDNTENNNSTSENNIENNDNKTDSSGFKTSEDDNKEPINEKIMDKAVAKLKNDGDIKGSTFGKLRLRGGSRGKKVVLLKWTKVSGAKTYVIYGNMCNSKGKKYYYKKIKRFNAKTFKFPLKNILKAKLKRGKYYKFIMTALDKDGKVIAVSKTVHVNTAGGKYGNDKSVKRVSPKNGKVTLKVKKSRKLRVKEVKSKKKVQHHRAVAWETSNSKIAVVKKGKVTAKGKGTCTIYAYAQNGVYTTFKVTVK